MRLDAVGAVVLHCRGKSPLASQPSREADMTQKITHKMWMRGEHKDTEPILTWCEGSHKKLDVIPEWANITPMWMGKCGFCWADMKPNKQGIAPKHPPSRQKFTFTIKYPDICQIGWHPIPAGTKCRYFGVKLVCEEHI